MNSNEYISVFFGTEAWQMDYVNNIEKIDSLGKFGDIICRSVWSPSLFNLDNVKKMHRSNKNFKSISYLVFDIDDGLCVETARKIIAENRLTGLIATTRHHQKEKITKSGSIQPPCDRFRIVLVLEDTIYDIESYGSTWRHYKNTLFPSADEACKDPARFYFSSTEVIEIFDGDPCQIIHRDTISISHNQSASEINKEKGILSKHTKNFIENGAREGHWHNAIIKSLYDLKKNNYSQEEAIELLKEASPQKQLDDEDFRQIKDIYENRDVKYPPRTVAGTFKLTDDGVYYQKNADEEIWICSKLEVVAVTRDSENKAWGRLLHFKDKDGHVHEWAMPMEMLSGDGADYRRQLLSMGLEISSEKNARTHLNEYIQRAQPIEKVRCVPRVGWNGKNYVLPEQSFGPGIDGERVILQTISTGLLKIKTSGTLEEWKEQVALPCKGNSRLVLALSTSFAGPLLQIMNEESGGFHFRGPSSTGKTTALYVAGSVWGGGGVNGYVEKWRATSNGLEAIAYSHCDGLLLLDELAQIDPKEAGNTAYMLANGSGKSRADKLGESRQAKSWRLLFLSSGEIGLADHMAKANQTIKAGQETRMIDIPVDAKKGMGLFETIHLAEDPADFARQIFDSANRFYGIAIVAFLRDLVEKYEEIPKKIEVFRNSFMNRLDLKNPSGQVTRVANRFSLAAAAGELAIELGILPWPSEEALIGCLTCFNAWLDGRGGTGELEKGQALDQVIAFLQENRARFREIRCKNNDKSENGFEPVAEYIPHKQAGFTKTNDDGSVEFLVFKEVFKKEVCAGLDPKFVAYYLLEQGYLDPDSAGKVTRPERLPGNKGTTRVYRIKSSIMGEES